MAVIGNTIKLRAEFKDYEGNLCDPDSVELRILDNMKRQLGDTMIVSTIYRVSTGIYEYPFVVPDGAGQLTYEFRGTIEGNPAIGRGTITRTWS
jgi:hypothetical protein